MAGRWSYFNPRAPCGARRRGLAVSPSHRIYFNPRAPCGARPTLIFSMSRIVAISTHAPLAGRDNSDVQTIRELCNFNPRAPCGARPTACSSFALDFTFQPTRPLRGATVCFPGDLSIMELFQPTRPLRGATRAETWEKIAEIISTHAPLAGRDSLYIIGNYV